MHKQKKNGNANIYQNDFIRVYANGTNSSSGLLSNDNWYLGEGNGDNNTDGNCGQWGLKFANSIVNTTNVPVAIFNGAHGGKKIEFFLAPNDYQTSLTSNYGRLYHRLNQTGLKDYVRAILWSQGERDATPSVGTTLTQYKDRFVTLKNSWSTDYPNTEHIYIFQTKNGCDKPIINLMRIKEAQRQLATENSNITIIPTAAMTHHSDNCHFPLINGYEKFSDRLSPLILQELYGSTTTSLDIDAPMIISAFMNDATTLTIETNATTDLEIATIAEDFEIHSTIQTTITNINVVGSNIIMTLSNNLDSNESKVSYLAQVQGNSGNFITNANNLELICFYEYPIDLSTLSVNSPGFNQNVKLFPSPSTYTIQVVGLNNKSHFIILDVLGSEIMSGHINNNQIIDIKNLANGLYFLKFDNENTIKFIK